MGGRNARDCFGLYEKLTSMRKTGGMYAERSPLSPEHWLHCIFASKQVQKGGVIRRSARDVERFCGMQAFQAEITRRGYQVIENGGQFIIICNQEPIRRIL